jgi:hypothetical protein
MKKMEIEQMECIQGGWTQENTVEAICMLGPVALFWCAPAAFALKASCVITGGLLLYYHATQ